MPGAFTFPGVYTQEQDFSLYLPALTSTSFAIVTTASKGPVNQRVLVSTEEQLINTFGFPGAQYKGLIAAQQYLRQGNLLWVVRVAGYDEATATATLRNSADSANAVVLTASSSGSWANGSSGLSAEVTAGNLAGTYTVRLRWNGYLVETFDSVKLNPSDDDDFIETRMASSAYATAVVTAGQTTLEAGSTNFSGGVDGTGVNASDYVGTIVGSTRTGLKLFSDPRQVDVNTICAPGVDDSAVIAELLAICESRQDCFALVDPPFGLDETEIVDWHNGVLGGSSKYPTSSLNSSYGAMYWPWCRVYDSYNNESVWAPPSGFAAQQYAYTDKAYDVWYAPAGFRRGKLPQVLETERIPSQGGGDYMYGGRAGTFGVNAVNPIMSFVGSGTVIWGDRTLQRSPTALDRVPVRRMLLMLRKAIATSVMYLTFEPNDERMWDDFKNLINPLLRTVKAGRGLRDYKVIMDETTNPDSLRDRNEALGRILLKPQKTAEIINVNFALLPQGANFDEFLSTTAS